MQKSMYKESISQIIPKAVISKNLISLTLNKICKKLIYEKSAKNILDYIYEELKILIPYDRIGVALVKDNHLQYWWAKSHGPIEHLKEGFSALIVDGGSIQKILQSNKPRIINDLEKYYKENPESQATLLALKDGLRSSVTYPLIYKGESLGIIFFSSFEKNTYTREHLDIFQNFSEVVSLVVGYQVLKLQEQNQVKDKTLSMVLHDLRSPISIMMSFLDSAMHKSWFESLPTKDQNSLKIIEKNCCTMLRLVEDLSVVLQLDRQQLPFRFKEIPFKSFLDEFCVHAEMLAKEKNIHFMSNIDIFIPDTVVLDKSRINQVLENLISNAIKFSVPNTTITFSVYFTDDNKLHFLVQDEGQGIPQEELCKLFKEFGRTSIRPTQNEPSNGLGLAISKQIVEAHGGDFFVNTQLGKGSIFQFYLPVKQKENL